MANVSVADKIKVVEEDIRQLKQELDQTKDPTERAGIRQQLAAKDNLLASYQTGMHNITC
jgi:hypothetical protein